MTERDGDEPELPKARKKVSAAPVAASATAAVSTSLHAPTSSRGTYTNAQRERDRYMWQWKDFVCVNCGFCWPKHAVTISYRQTAVSECLKQKRACALRTISQRVLDGDIWLTNKHVIGQGGLDLTPTPQEVLDAEAEGTVVGYLRMPDHTTTRQVFRLSSDLIRKELLASWGATANRIGS